MPELLCEGFAFAISLIAFLYGVFKIFTQRAPFYFKLIIGAVGCYVLEEFWAIVNAICQFNASQLSIRLIGVFGCYCTFFVANAKGLNKVIDDGDRRNKKARVIAILAPLFFFAAFIAYAVPQFNAKSFINIASILVVFFPAIIDSYFELKYLIIPNDEMGFVRFVRPINVLVLVEYAISLSYLFILSNRTQNIMDVVSAIVIALIVLECRKGTIKWKTLI